jgi:hypothetical protein
MPILFHSLAKEYLRAAKGFEVINDFSPVHYFLYCMSIELSLKAFLLGKDFPVSMLKKGKDKKGLGHDLKEALNQAESRGLDDIVDVGSEYKEKVIRANYYYVKKQVIAYGDDYEVLARIYEGDQGLDLKVLGEFASILVEKLERVCWELAGSLVEKYGEGKMGW